MFDIISIYSGLIATIWFVLGVFLAGRFYPGYNHSKQFCSELGATDSPTEKLSPLINNYPLGFLFCFFGWYLVQLSNISLLVNSAGCLIIVHGIGTWIAGYFPMDADPYTKKTTLSGNIHSYAGFIMLLSLVIAPILIAISPTSETIPLYFRLFSTATIIVSVYYIFAMLKAIKNKSKPGLYQRISYGLQLTWLSVFSLVLM